MTEDPVLGKSALRLIGIGSLMVAVALVWLFFGDLPRQVDPGDEPLPSEPALSREADSGQRPLEPVKQAESVQTDGADRAALPDSPRPAMPEARRTAQTPSARVFGTVRDLHDKPLPNVLLRWIPVSKSLLSPFSNDLAVVGARPDAADLPDPRVAAALGQSLTTRTDSTGGYEILLPTAEESSALAAWRAGYETVLEAVRFEKGHEVPLEKQVDFQLLQGGSIRGRVIEVGSGLPASGMSVAAALIQNDRPSFYSSIGDWATALVRPDGTYALDGLRAGIYRVRPATELGRHVSYPENEGTKVVLASGATVDGVDFEVKPGGQIRGRVRTPAGRLLADVRLRLSMPLNNRRWAEMLGRPWAVSNSRGYFEFRGLELGQTYRILALKEGFAQVLSEWVGLTSENPEVLADLTLDEGYSISGRVVYRDGGPAADWTVSATPKETDYRRRQGRTDAAGAFTIGNLPACGYVLHASPSERTSIIRGGPQKVEVLVEANDLTDVLITLDEPGKGRISGRVEDDQGLPVERAWVRFANQDIDSSRISGAGGEFLAEGLPEGSYLVTGEKTGYSRAVSRDVATGQEGVVLALNRHGRVSGKVLAWDGSPLDSLAQVEAVPAGLSWLEYNNLGTRQGHRAPAAGNGTFLLEAPSGRIEIRASAPGFAPTATEPILLAPGKEVTGIEIRLRRGAVLRGRLILAEDQSPVEGAEVALLPKEQKQRRNNVRFQLMRSFVAERHLARSGADGRFELADLAGGDYWMLAKHPELVPSDLQVVSLRDGDHLTLPDSALAAGGIISGRVSDGGQALPGIGVTLTGDGESRSLTADPEGLFRIEGIRPGSYQLLIHDLTSFRQGLRNKLARSVELPGPQTLDVEIDYADGVRVQGSVTGLDGAYSPVASMRSEGPRSRYQFAEVRIREDGSFEIRGLEAGRYALVVYSLETTPGESSGSFSVTRKTHYRTVVEVPDHDLQLHIDASQSEPGN